MKRILSFLLSMLLLVGFLHAEGKKDGAEKKKDTPKKEDSVTDEGHEGGDSEEVAKTFYGNNFINLPTIETNRARAMGFRISHRLGPIFEPKAGGGIAGPDFYNFLGLNGASVLIGLDYGITDDLTVGIDHATVGKINGVFAKYKILAQTQDNSMPITLTAYGRANATHLRHPAMNDSINPYGNFANRVSYSSQIMVAKKFGEAFSLQVAPTFVHYNLVDSAAYANSMFGICAGAKVKVLKRLSITAEYSRVLNNHVTEAARDNLYSDNLGISFDMVTGGHVFQIFVVNSRGINDTQVIPYTRSAWQDGQVRFGFNIYRNFSL